MPTAAEALTTKDPKIALEDLEILLEPMTKDEIGVEANGWFDLVRAKGREIAAAELDVHRKNREIAQLEKQKTAAAELARATQEVKATSDTASDKDKVAAAEHLAEAQKKLAKTVETAGKEAAKEEKKAEAVAAVTTDKVGEAKSADATPAVSEQKILQKAVETAEKKSEATGNDKKVHEIVAATQKEAAASEEIKSLAQAAPAAAGTAVQAASQAPQIAAAAANDTSRKAEKLAQKADEATAAKTDVKVQLVDYSTQLRSERTALTDRLKLVLDKWEARGGDPNAYRAYIASTSGIKIDISDRAATWARITSWLAADEGGLRWARDAAIFLAYVLGSIVVAWIMRPLLRRMMAMRGTNASSHLLREFIVGASGRVIVIIGLLLGLSALEVNLAPLLAVIGAASFVVAFALQGTLSNFASGLLIMVYKPFDEGDEVEVSGGINGKVGRVTIFSTHIFTADGHEKIVPNDNIWKNVIVNNTTGLVKGAADSVALPDPDDSLGEASNGQVAGGQRQLVAPPA